MKTLIPALGSRKPSVHFRGLKLGILAFIANFIVVIGLGLPALPAGNVPLFVAAGSLPFSGLLVALGSGLIPLALCSPPLVNGFARTFFLCLVLWMTAKRFPRLPGFVVGAFLWIFLFRPLSPADTLAGLADIFFLLIAGMLLLSPDVWQRMTEQNRPINLSVAMMHILASIAAISMLGIFTIAGPSALPSLHPDRVWIFSVIAIMAAAFLGSRLAIILEQSMSETRVSGMLKAQNAFSGLASGFWRRHLDEISRQNTEAISSKLEAFTTGPLEEQSPVPRHILSSDLGVCLIHKDGTIAFVNRKFRQFMGISSSSVNGKRLDLVGIDPLLSAQLLAKVEKGFMSGGEVTETKVNQLPDQLRFFEIRTVLPQMIESSTLSGGTDGIVILVKDITERRTIEAKLLKAQKVESMGMMMQGIARAFNTALSVIAADASVGLTTDNPEFKDTFFRQILNEAKEHGELTNDLIEFAIERPLKMEYCNLHDLLKSKMEFLKKMVGEGCEISFPQHHEAPLFVRCDSTLITQALTNLVSNAKEAYTDEGKIDVSLELELIAEEVARLNPGTSPGSYARLRVRDEGEGMTAEVLSKAFDPLYTTKGAEGHAGLGLSTAFAVVRAHDGFLTLESHPGKGSTISLYLPVAIVPPDNQVATDSKQPVKENLLLGSGQRLLIIEEHGRYARSIARMVETLGYAPVVAASLTEACALKGPFAALIIDSVSDHSREALHASLDELPKLILSPSPKVSCEKGKVLRKPFTVWALGEALNDVL